MKLCAARNSVSQHHLLSTTLAVLTVDSSISALASDVADNLMGMETLTMGLLGFIVMKDAQSSNRSSRFGRMDR